MGFRRSCRSRSLRRRDPTPTRGYGPTHEERREGSMTTATPTQLGMVGLGRMGANIVRRLMRDGHPCVVHDLSSEAVATLASEGATGADSIEAFVGALRPPRTVWVMVPAGEPTEQAVGSLAGGLAPGDVVIDGGNTYYRDDLRRAKDLAIRGIDYVDCGTSGGVFGLD